MLSLAPQLLQVKRIPVLSRTLEPAQHTNTYLVGGAGEAVLIDAGFVAVDSGLAAIVEAWRELGEPKLLGVMVTHGHQDHARGLNVLAEHFSAPVYAHPVEWSRIAEVNPGLELRPIHDGQEWQVEGRRLAVIGTPGHTAGHLSYWFPDNRLLLCGDTMAGEGTVWVGPPDGNMSDYLKSLDRIEALHPARIGAGHGPWIENPTEAIAQLREHRLMRERQILGLLAEGPRTSSELARAIYAGQVSDRILPFAEKTVLAHLDKLMAEGRVVMEQAAGMPHPRYRIG